MSAEIESKALTNPALRDLANRQSDEAQDLLERYLRGGITEEQASEQYFAVALKRNKIADRRKSGRRLQLLENFAKSRPAALGDQPPSQFEAKARAMMLPLVDEFLGGNSILVEQFSTDRTIAEIARLRGLPIKTILRVLKSQRERLRKRGALKVFFANHPGLDELQQEALGMLGEQD